MERVQTDFQLAIWFLLKLLLPQL